VDHIGEDVVAGVAVGIPGAGVEEQFDVGEALDVAFGRIIVPIVVVKLCELIDFFLGAGERQARRMPEQVPDCDLIVAFIIQAEVGRYSTRGRSTSIRPASTSCMMAVPTKDFDTEAMLCTV
jgi:hypothetical protein